MRVIVANSKKDTVPEVIQREFYNHEIKEIGQSSQSGVEYDREYECDDDVANLSVLSKRNLRAIPRPVQQLLPILSLTATTMGTLLFRSLRFYTLYHKKQTKNTHPFALSRIAREGPGVVVIVVINLTKNKMHNVKKVVAVGCQFSRSAGLLI